MPADPTRAAGRHRRPPVPARVVAGPASATAKEAFASEGVTLLYGRDERALEAAELLKDHLDVTLLIKPPAEVAPARVTEFPVVKGSIRAAKGRLGAFELTIDDFDGLEAFYDDPIRDGPSDRRQAD